jgi:hypothetical protein
LTIVLAAALILSVAGFLVILDRRDQRDRDERQMLLQRIQAPEQAVYEHATRAPDPSPFPQSDEQLAEQEARQALDRIAEMERQANFEFRGRPAMRKDAPLRRVCHKFFVGDHYWYVNARARSGSSRRP